MVQVYDSKKGIVVDEFRDYYKLFKVLVTNDLSRRDLDSIITDLSVKNVSFAVSKSNKKGFCIWREILEDEIPISKNGLPIYGEIVVTDKELLDSRNFVEIWNKGKLFFKRKF